MSVMRRLKCNTVTGGQGTDEIEKESEMELHGDGQKPAAQVCGGSERGQICSCRFLSATA
jgi:hypothetical protein